MIKKLGLLICFVLIGFIVFLTVPLPRSMSNVFEHEFRPEKPTAFRVEEQQKCQDTILYIKKNQFGYSDSEVINERCAKLQSELANAAIDGNLVEMRLLIEKGASAQSPAFSKHTSDAFQPVIIAAWNKQTQAVKLLLDNGADVNSHFSCCMASQSLLMVAVSMNDVTTTKLLLARNADLNFR
jgi:ankyrin repeat protein